MVDDAILDEKEKGRKKEENRYESEHKNESTNEYINGTSFTTAGSTKKIPAFNEITANLPQITVNTESTVVMGGSNIYTFDKSPDYIRQKVFIFILTIVFISIFILLFIFVFDIHIHITITIHRYY